MNKKINSRRGFTLVELLAVIVVLAIVMLIALQAVLPAMDSARRQTFAIEANGAIDAANTYFMSSMWVSDAGSVSLPIGNEEVCISIEALYNAGYTELSPENYSGQVVVKKKGNIYLYTANVFQLLNRDTKKIQTHISRMLTAIRLLAAGSTAE